MAIGVVSDDEFDLELEKSNQSNWKKATLHYEPVEPSPEVITPEIVETPHRGRQENDVNVPDSLRQIIGETSELEGRAAAVKLAKEFGISSSSVSAYANGATSTKSYDTAKESIRDHINRSKERISKRARRNLNLALSNITPEKLAAAKLRDLSGLAKDMSGIVKDMEPNVNLTEAANKPQFVFYSPQFKKEEHFDVIVVKE